MSTDIIFNRSFWQLFVLADLKKKNIANNETTERSHNSSRLGKRYGRTLVLGMDLIFFRKKNV